MLTPSPGPGHPRVCGEQVRSVTRPWLGSRAIPACAGNRLDPDTGALTCTGPSPRVRGTGISTHGTGSGAPGHPRVCGEQVYALAAAKLLGRAIPACAGNRARNACTLAAVSRPSPRVRGTGTSWRASRRGPDGPSPRVRGTGTTRRPRRYTGTTGHPRVCGEQSRRPYAGGRYIGPSPRVRGTGPLTPAACARRGPSPRVRGTAGARSAGSLTGSGHPRVCGEQTRCSLGFVQVQRR